MKIDVIHDVALLYLEKSLPAEVPIMLLASPGQKFEKYVRFGHGRPFSSFSDFTRARPIFPFALGSGPIK